MSDFKSKETTFPIEFMQQLHREYENLCYLYNLKTKRPIIGIFQKENSPYLGSWDPQKRMISLSHDLLMKNSWSLVLDILKHEVAHQLFDETDLFRDAYPNESRPHGPRFQKICQYLGLPATFQRACLKPEDLNRQETDLPEVRKIRKLMRLNQSSNQNEAKLALQKAHELSVKFNLDLNAPKNPFNKRFLHRSLKRLYAWEHTIAHILNEHFSVSILIGEQFQAQMLTSVKGFWIMGEEHHLEMAYYVYDCIMTECHHKPMGYCQGFVEGYLKSLQKKQHETGLVIRKDPKLQAYIKTQFPKTRTQKIFQKKRTKHFHEGFEKGRNWNFKKPVPSRSQKQLSSKALA